jgi:hypothetical protein
MAKWLPSQVFTRMVHHLDARVGGGFRMSFTNFGTSRSHSTSGTCVEMVSAETGRLGWQESLAQYATLVEPGVPNG